MKSRALRRGRPWPSTARRDCDGGLVLGWFTIAPAAAENDAMPLTRHLSRLGRGATLLITRLETRVPISIQRDVPDESGPVAQPAPSRRWHTHPTLRPLPDLDRALGSPDIWRGALKPAV